MYFKKHVFVCENVREEGERPSCGPKGSPQLLAYMKKRLQELGFKDKIRVQRSGCLDRCELGPVQVAYPEGHWFSLKTKEDAEEFIQNYILKNETNPIRRLMLEDEA
ncbi:(2Fe-2S) ferredoxin domain-containing protein [Leptospira langatensis]|uniref:(2Fe-2S) ferredoxin domain-containing protein n=1 Tax=Leptospira langatensis TaxID=2484983 RepID=A0A5F1ZVP1_9LEPT|nr:(2Fe-2S) ferredoxin domain-containing protein [Leptospira langatensis]TGK02956.1 (2Fe-2S) ferredoxin domain-containing protein [Leptospira langatensis]TGL41711.1 (2Fe-2S) ferredoxin domain-containing protein [Leptospira langatensis]